MLILEKNVQENVFLASVFLGNVFVGGARIPIYSLRIACPIVHCMAKLFKKFVSITVENNYIF